MKRNIFISIILLLCTIAIVFLNLLGLMRLIPMYFTIPVLFIFIYVTIYTFTYRNMYRGHKQHRHHLH